MTGMPMGFSLWPTAMSYTPSWESLTRVWHQHVRTGTRASSKLIVFTDPVGTLLDHRTHPCIPSCEALRVLADHNVPLVLCSSRTRAELEIIQQEFHFRHPFISESGAAVYLPRGYFSPPSDPAADMSGYDILAFGGPHQHVVETLRRIAEAQAIAVRGFNDMSVQEVADECGLSLAEGRLAQLREYGELFRILSSDPAVHSRLLSSLRRAGLRCVNGGRFHHVSFGADVRRSIQALTSLYRQRFGRVLTVGVSAGLTDLTLLREVDIPIVVLDSEIDPARVLRKAPTARVTSATGSAGWDEAILLAVEPELTKVSGRR